MIPTKNFTIHNCLLSYGEHKIPLISGEFHYWRVFKENWPAVTAAIKKMGLSVVSTYIPWNYHELKPGTYDFHGKTSPQRDLEGFIKLLEKENLYLIVRPGPYIYSEWIHGGVPERAKKYDRLSPEFLKMARHYMDAVCRVLVPHQITRGGNIILFQADNEPYPPVESFGDEIGCFARSGMFTEFLREKYKNDLNLLNQKWKTRFTSFDDACFYFHEAYVNTDLPMAERLLPSNDYYMRYADSLDFIGWYAARIVRTVGGWQREAGVNVPIYSNSWSPLYADFSMFCKTVDLAGADIYPDQYISGARLTEDNWLYNIDILKMLEADVSGGNVWSAEFQSGLYPINLVGYLDPPHFKFVPLALMARGLKGFNWYMLVARDNWYHCPINEWGRENEYYPVHTEVVKAVKAIEPWHTEPLYDVDLLISRAHRVISPGNFKKCFDMLETGDISYAYYDPRSGNAPRTNVMIYSGADWLEQDVLLKLRGFIEAGGIFIVFSQHPARDEYGQIQNILPFAQPEGARPTNLPVTLSYGANSVIIKNAGHMGRKVNFCYYRSVEGAPIRVTLSTVAKEALVDINAVEAVSFYIGSARKIGSGKILHIGANPSADILRMILETEKNTPFVSCANPSISTAFHRHKNKSLLLYVINRSKESKTAKVAVNISRLGIKAAANIQVINILSGKTLTMKGRGLTEMAVDMGANDVNVLKLKEIR